VGAALPATTAGPGGFGLEGTGGTGASRPGAVTPRLAREPRRRRRGGPIEWDSFPLLGLQCSAGALLRGSSQLINKHKTAAAFTEGSESDRLNGFLAHLIQRVRVFRAPVIALAHAGADGEGAGETCAEGSCCCSRSRVFVTPSPPLDPQGRHAPCLAPATTSRNSAFHATGCCMRRFSPRAVPAPCAVGRWCIC
jgi:hypothetical protein